MTFVPDISAWFADPAPSGLTAAQEIRTRLFESLLVAGGEIDEGAVLVLRPFAAWCEHGDGMTREQLAAAIAERGIPEPPAACPDPSLHEDVDVDGVINTLIQERDDYAARLKATDQAWAAVAAERDEARAAACPDPDDHRHLAKSEAARSHLREQRSKLRAEVEQVTAARDEARAQVASAGLMIDGSRKVIEALERQRETVLELASRMDISGQHAGPFWADEVRRAIYHGDEAAFGVINEPYPDTDGEPTKFVPAPDDGNWETA